MNWLAFLRPALLVLAMPTIASAQGVDRDGQLVDAGSGAPVADVFIAADIFGYVCWNKNDTGIGQRLEELAPHVDYFSPMLYPSGYRWGIPGAPNPVANSYSIVRESLEEAQGRLGISPRRFRPWLQAFRDYAFDRRAFGGQEVSDQIRAAEDFGADGWMLWNAGNDYSDAGLVTPRKGG